jgi:hypothetical protein
MSGPSGEWNVHGGHEAAHAALGGPSAIKIAVSALDCIAPGTAYIQNIVGKIG